MYGTAEAVAFVEVFRSLLGPSDRLPKAGGGKVCQHLHGANVSMVKCIDASMSHEDSSARTIDLPREQDPIRHGWRFHSEDFEEPLRDAEELWPTALEANIASTRIAGKDFQLLPARCL
jgi:hypothetical protein